MLDIHPAIVEDFPLEKFTEKMTQEQREGFFQGFSKAFTTLISAINRNEKLFLPREKMEMLEHLSDLMIDIVNQEKIDP